MTLEKLETAPNFIYNQKQPIGNVESVIFGLNEYSNILEERLPVYRLIRNDDSNSNYIHKF